MPAPASFSDQITALPAGAGGVQGLGETFGADPSTGTGSFRIPIATPAGHRGQTPQLALVYSSGAGAGLCGAGWSFGVGSVRRRADKGVPTYGEDDVFLLGDDELLPLSGGYYLRRTEGAFARIRRCLLHGEDFWAVTDRTGVRRLYGRQRAHRDGPDGTTSAWLLSEERDACNNAITYTWERDAADQRSYLQQVVWGGTAYRVLFTYGTRPDVLRSGRQGYVETTRRRLSRIEVQVKRTSTGVYTTFDRYDLAYTQSPITGLSLLSTCTRTGFDAAGASRVWPVLSMTYQAPVPRTSVVALTGHPGGSLSDPSVQLCDLDGDGLPDLLESTSYGMLVRRNLGDGKFSTPVPIRSPRERLQDQGVFLSDMRGSGRSDLVTKTGFYPNEPDGTGKLGFGVFRPFDQRPSFDLEGPTTRFVDLDGDGVGDVVVQQGADLWLFRNTFADRLPGGRAGAGFAVARKVTGPARLPRLDDEWTRLADTTGDGLTDWVRITRGSIEVYQALGHGRFAEPRVLTFGEQLPPWVPSGAISLSDLTGTGCADVVVHLGNEVWVFPNATGESLGKKFVLQARGTSPPGRFEVVDLLGTGTKGLLFSEPGQAWSFYRLFGDDKPDQMQTVQNGLGLTTSITYGSSTTDLKRDRERAQPWRYPLPFPVRVVHRIQTVDAVSTRTATTRYQYHHGAYDGLEREFRGFALVDQLDTDTSPGDTTSSPPSRVRRFFDVGNGLRLRDLYAPVPGVLPPEDLPAHPLARRALRSKLVREETYTDDGSPDFHRPYLVTHTTYRVVSVLGPTDPCPYFAAPSQVDTWHTERTGEVRHTVTTSVYDRYGRATETRERGDGRLGTFNTAHELQQAQTLERSTRTTYLTLFSTETDDYNAVYTPTWMLDMPSVVERWGGAAGSETLLARTRTFYDGVAYVGGSVLTKGLPTQVQELSHTTAGFTAAYPVGSTAGAAKTARGAYLQDGTDWYVQTSRLQFDSKGLVTGSRDPRGNTTIVTYDATHGLFPITVTDPAGHPTTLTRGELPQQVSAVVDANDNRTEFTYDPSGLPATKSVMGKFMSGAWQGDPTTHPTEVYEYDFAAVPNRVTTKTRQVRISAATVDVHRYADGAGKVLQERHTAETAGQFRVTGHQVYNHKGLVVRAYQPTFASTSAYAAAATTVPFLETVYDPLGRPLRVNHPDGTFETTTYHPWVKTTSDRNDNAGSLLASDPRYGAHLAGFRTHLNTPTRTFVDALGRDIAVQEDNGAGTLPTFRVTTYELTSSEFAAAALTYDLTCNQDLVANHFVFVRGMVAGATTQHGSAGVRVTHDPFGTGDLDVSSGPRVLRLTRGSAAQGVWSGTVTVVECLGDAGASGFQLVDVKRVVFPSAAAAGEQVINTTSNTAWTNLAQVALYGAWGQGGMSTASVVAGVQGLHAGFAPSGTNAIAGSRWSITTLPAADATVYVVQWGSEHTLQRIVVTGTTGGDDLDIAPEWGTTAVLAHRTQEVFVTATGWTKAATTGGGFTATLAVLGNGLSPMPDVASTVAVGSEVASDKKLWVTLHRHPALVAHHVRSATNTGATATESLTVSPAGELETYDTTAPVLGTAGQRLPLLATSHTSAATSFAQATWSARCSADTTLQGKRITGTGAYLAWGTAVDLCRIERPGSTAALHVTRTVLDLLDRPVEVWDARGLAAATWVYAYDARGQRTKAEHTTGTGVRYTLSDAAGNPIWSRDARAVEVDRTFDVLNRPLTETSGAGLRRQWTYLAYSAGNTAAKTVNLFGRVDEERDQDGIRWFEYDWRGLVTKVSHRFWVEGAAVYTAVDDVVPATARTSLATWLALPGLPDTTTVVVTTVYDAAGRPTSEAWPTLTRAWQYNAAGTLQEAGYNDGTAKVGVNAVTYNARGQVTGWSHGNGLTTVREYDSVTERLTRIFTRRVSPELRLQDLAYAYDPVGNPVAITDQLASSTFTSNNIITNTRRYGYDPRYRLIRSTGKRHKNATDGIDAPNTPAPAATDYLPYTHRYAYDAVGNFTVNQEYTRSALKYKTAGLIDRFDGTGAEVYGYDANGNTTSTPRHTSLGYQWDSQPTLIDMGGGGKVRYRRHGDQKVLRFKTTGFRLTLGVWEYENRTAATAFTKTTLHVAGPAGRCAQVEKVLTGADATSLPVFHVHGDHLGSGQCLTKADGTLLCQEEFFAYGRSSDRRDTRNRYRFIGVERDEDTGLCMTGPRTYDPVSGRFLQGDPLDGGPPFVYSRGNPVGRMDANGYADKKWEAVPDLPGVDDPKTQERWKKQVWGMTKGDPLERDAAQAIIEGKMQVSAFEVDEAGDIGITDADGVFEPFEKVPTAMHIGGTDRVLVNPDAVKPRVGTSLSSGPGQRPLKGSLVHERYHQTHHHNPGEDPYAVFDVEAETTYNTDFRKTKGTSVTNELWSSFPTLREQRTIQEVVGAYSTIDKAMADQAFRDYVKNWKPHSP